MNKLPEPLQTPEPSEPSQQSAAPISRHQPLELLILAAFIGTWLFTKDAIAATMVLTGGTLFQIIVMTCLKMPITKMQKTMFVAILIGGGLTIAFRDEQFIQWKLTVVNSIFALVLFVLHILEKAPIKTMFESITTGQDMTITMPNNAWNKITFIFISFFLAVAAVNTYIILMMDFNAWVIFRSALFVISLVFLPAVLMLFFIKYKAIQQPQDQTKSKD